MDTTQFSPVEGGPQSVRGSYTPNWVQIFKGVVTLYSFSPFQFTIRHTTAPLSCKASIRLNVVVPFTCGLLLVQGNATPVQIFAKLLFQREHFHSCSLVSPFKISDNNSTYPPPPPICGPLNKIDKENLSRGHVEDRESWTRGMTC